MDPRYAEFDVVSSKLYIIYGFSQCLFAGWSKHFTNTILIRKAITSNGCLKHRLKYNSYVVNKTSEEKNILDDIHILEKYGQDTVSNHYV